MGKTSINLAMSGSSTKLPLHVGALRAIYEQFQIDEIWGNSGGSIIGAMYACHLDPDEIHEIVLNTDFGRLAGVNLFSWLLFPWRKYLSTGRRFEKFLKRHLGTSRFEDRSLRVPLGMVASDMNEEQEVIFSSDNNPYMPIWKAVRASTCLPFWFRPVEWEGKELLDGGLFRDFPIGLASRTERKTIGILIENEKEKPRPRGIRPMANQILSMLIKANIKRSIERCQEHDDMPEMIVRLSYPVSTYDFDVTREQKIDMMWRGYERTKEAIGAWS